MRGMYKAGLIGLGVGALFGVGITLLIPYCTPCAAILVGLAVGYLTCVWEKPAEQSAVAGLGAKAGAIAGAGSLVGQLLGMLLNGLLVGPQGVAEVLAQFGLEPGTMSPRLYWITQIAVNTSCGLTNVALAAGLGALGGLLWRQATGGRQGPTDSSQHFPTS
jgi:hypothetical protein